MIDARNDRVGENKKLKSVLLIDDNIATNLIHTKLIQRQWDVDKIKNCTSASEAIALLETNGQEVEKPDLVFLDINMPEMDGWSFLEEYKNLSSQNRFSTIIYMLTTSINPEDRKRAELDPTLAGFLIKPLSTPLLSEILERHFEN